MLRGKLLREFYLEELNDAEENWPVDDVASPSQLRQLRDKSRLYNFSLRFRARQESKLYSFEALTTWCFTNLHSRYADPCG